MQGTVVSVEVAAGDQVQAGQPVIVLESMKMEHVVTATAAGVVAEVKVATGETVMPGDLLVDVDTATASVAAAEVEVADITVDVAHVRKDLSDVQDRHALGLDEARPDA